MVSYTVTELPDAIVVRGPIPVRVFAGLCERAKQMGLEDLDIGLASALNATLVVTNEAGSARLRAEHEASIADREPLERWLHGCDTGISSMTMAHAMFGTPLWRGGHADIPHDPADFGRCVRFLDCFAGSRERLSAVSEAFPEWQPLIREWPALEALYREEAATGTCPRLYARLRELEEECQSLRPRWPAK